MGKKVIIAEKPSVAREFAKVLNVEGVNKNGYIEGKDVIVTWCVGHLVTMSYPEVYDEKLRFWKLSTLPFIPKEFKYEVIDNVKQQFEIVSQILNREDVDCIYVCTDSGREGEYIYRLVDKMAGCPNKEKKRVWIDSQTKEAILEGIKNAKMLNEYDSLADSAYLRAKEDYLIGINFSRLLSLVYSKNLAKLLNQDKVVISVGRVMTCVLGIIVDRERKIRNFVKTSFYKLQAQLMNEEKQKLEVEWKVSEKSKYFESTKLYNETGFIKEEDALDLINQLKQSNHSAIVKEVTKKKQKENPLLLYNLAELQNECSKKFKITPDETLQIVQTLYEKKMVTYPRTDARVLSTAVAKEIAKNLNGLTKIGLDEDVRKYIDKMVSEKYSIDLIKTKYVDDSKITDHYAIIPTGQGAESYNRIDKLQKDVYHLIVKRFLSIFYPSAEFMKVNVVVCIGKEQFTVSGKVCTALGYLEVIKNDKNENSDENKENENESQNLDILINLKKGQELQIIDIITKEGQTSPPTRFSSGSIILAMENAGKLIENEELRQQIKGSGIGTSATRAEIIKKLTKIGYIELNQKTQILTPSVKGEKIYDIVACSMPDMLNPQLTASWEKGLTMVAQDEIKAEEFMIKLEDYINKKVKGLKGKYSQYYY